MGKPNSFKWSTEVVPHKTHAKKLIAEYPEIRKLFGKNPYTFLIILFCVSFQLFISWLLRNQPWWLILILSYAVGAFACHTLFVCIHECAHNLLFKKKTFNSIAGMIANLVLIFPSSVSFQKYHLKHHSHLGIEAFDADIPYRWEAALINNSVIGKTIWLLLFPFFQMIRPARLRQINFMDRWTAINWIVQFIFMGLFIYLAGWKPTLYLFLSFLFSVGLHPLGARWIQEHFLTHGEQETNSYYGILNTVNLNMGYHNEHHDFPSIPWNRLPALKKIASPYYSSLKYHSSYTALLFRFIWDPTLSVFSRITRADKEKTERKKVQSAKEPVEEIEKEI